MKRKWGIEILWIRETAAGTMLELRYKVVDAAKAKPLFERQAKPACVHEKTGLELPVPRPPKTGPLRSSQPPVDGKIYWMFFANPGRIVRPGDAVHVVIGGFRVDGLVVQSGANDAHEPDPGTRPPVGPDPGGAGPDAGGGGDPGGQR